ncbi:hypothetical protein [Pseudodonghicola flavimaris]|uniref:Translocase n=1 Tax=Pseudodonghicola flavimaris TaxID=3050036 RepID=A0ABT7EZY3_9RHOB|nr:hypothetical protein [Pseudodonghicola flavimaris]MDK3017903.1 hypothetical protein [Pseudodonghicola flavimaris]
MSKIRLIALACGTAACALTIGYVMQNTVAPRPVRTAAPVQTPASEKSTPENSQRPQTPADPATPAPAKAPVRLAQPEPLDLDKLALTSAPTEPDLPAASGPAAAADLLAPRSAQPATAAALPDTPADPGAPALGCDISATATAQPGGMVDLLVIAPCQPNARVVIHHHGMLFATATDDMGLLSLGVPALSEQAIFIAAFDDGEGAVASTRVPDLAEIDRIVLQWSGPGGFQLHAREFGAAYDSEGHIWSGQDPALDATQPHGAVLRLGGDSPLNPLTAEVYSFPAATTERSGTIELSIEAEITAQNCGRDISAQLLERQGAAPLKTRELDLSVPACNAVGDFLVLNNLLDDLKIAAK